MRYNECILSRQTQLWTEIKRVQNTPPRKRKIFDLQYLLDSHLYISVRGGGCIKFREHYYWEEGGYYKLQRAGIVYLFKLQGVCHIISKLLNLHQSHFNISVLFSSVIRPVLFTFGLEKNMMWKMNAMITVWSWWRWPTDLGKFKESSNHYDGITPLFPNHSPHIVNSELIRTFNVYEPKLNAKFSSLFNCYMQSPLKSTPLLTLTGNVRIFLHSLNAQEIRVRIDIYSIYNVYFASAKPVTYSYFYHRS